MMNENQERMAEAAHKLVGPCDEGKVLRYSQEDIAPLVEALRAVTPITVHNTPDYAELTFGGSQTQAMTMEPEKWEAVNSAFATFQQGSPALKHPEPSEATRAAADVLAERRRQIEAEGWTPEHDDQWVHGELALAAAGYAEAGGNVHRDTAADFRPSIPFAWAWSPTWWKPTDRRRDLVKAGALILAEIERIDRAALAAMGGE